MKADGTLRARNIPKPEVHTATLSAEFDPETRFMDIIGTILIGLLVGAVAKLLTPGRDPGGCLITILLGIAGSFVGTYLGQAIGLYRVGEPAGFIGSVVGAMLLLLLYRLIAGRPAP
jgi:uncharacterized membrane protein YeaQ/YmgE (transglycosylase-associated protein family)